MRWTIRYSGTHLARRLRVWAIRYPGLLAAIQRRIDRELAVDPESHLGPRCVPTTTRPYYLDLTPDGDSVSEPLHITFYVDTRPDARELIVIQGRLQTDRYPVE